MPNTLISLDDKIMDCLDDIATDFTNSKDFLRYQELNKMIYEQYQKELVYFESAKEIYQEAKKYGPAKKEAETLSRCKEDLFSKPLVKEMKELEMKIQKELDIMSNEIGAHLSNKFKEKRVI